MDPQKPILVAGDPERAHEAKVQKEGCIEYHINQINDSVSILAVYFEQEVTKEEIDWKTA